MVEPGYPAMRGNDPVGNTSRPLSFACERASGPAAAAESRPPWKLLIVDDEEEVHSLTRLVLRNYEFEGRGLELLSAYSGVSARKVLAAQPDIALILLDVVMEQEDSGLRLVQHIRGTLRNNNVRIILRTGQPGQAPEMDIVARYDINDYKAKTELTSQKLFTTVTSALRAWRDIQTIEQNRQGLECVIAASGKLLEWQQGSPFAPAVLRDLVAVAESRAAESGCGEVSGLAARREDGVFRVVAGVGRFSDCAGRRVNDVVTDNTGLMVTRASRRGEGLFFHNSYVSRLVADSGDELLFLLQGAASLGGSQGNLIHLFMANVATAFQNMNLSLEIIETQKEIIQTLGEVVETRSQETANHVLRVGKMARLLALHAGLSPDQATLLHMAVPMHDVGKVGIPDAILKKPGRLTPAEYRIMQSHAAIGRDILAKSQRPLMQAAAIVAGQHHERWDGTGYPAGLQGEEIHVFGRITALVDVFDAMASRRCYREAMEMDAVLAVIRDGRGTHFEPRLVDVFLANLTEFVSIIRAYPDAVAPRVQVAEEG